MRTLHPSDLDIVRDQPIHDSPVTIHESAWLLLGVGIILALTAIGISLLVIWATIGTEVPLHSEATEENRVIRVAGALNGRLQSAILYPPSAEPEATP